MNVDKEQTYKEFYDSLTLEDKERVYRAIELWLGVVSELSHPLTVATSDNSIYEVNVEVLETEE